MTSEHPKKACQQTGTGGKVCWLVLGHPGRVHVDVTDGGLVVWSPADGEKFRNVPLNTEDPTRDAPEALKARPDEQQCASQHPRNEALFCTRTAGHDGDHIRWRPNHVVRWPQTVPAPGDPTRDAPEAECGTLNPGGNVRCTRASGHRGCHHNQNNGVSWLRSDEARQCPAWSPSGQYLCTEPFGHTGPHRRDQGPSPIVWAN